MVLRVLTDYHDRTAVVPRVPIDHYDRTAAVLQVPIDYHDRTAAVLRVSIDRYDRTAAVDVDYQVPICDDPTAAVVRVPIDYQCRNRTAVVLRVPVVIQPLCVVQHDGSLATLGVRRRRLLIAKDWYPEHNRAAFSLLIHGRSRGIRCVFLGVRVGQGRQL